MTHADRDRSELHAYLAADKADYPRTWKGDGYARAEAAEAKVAELTAKLEKTRDQRQAVIDHNRQLIRERREAMDRAEAAERALALAEARAEALRMDAAAEIRHRRSAEAKAARVQGALSGHPECDKHADDDPIQCGWKRAVIDVRAALAGDA